MAPAPPLHAEIRGAGSPLVLLHGFTQSAGSWGPVGDALASAFTVVALDAPGHGRSADVRADLPRGADLMAETVDEVAGPGTWLGYSMGGRYALHVALRHPNLVERLVLVSATAGLDDPAEREARRRGDEALADRLEREGLEPFLRFWLAQPLFASLPPEAAQLKSRLAGSASGLAASLRLAGTGTQSPLWEQLATIRVPVLVVAGERDTKYADLGRRLAESIGPSASLALLPGAGHACHLEQPEAFLDEVMPWLERHGNLQP